MPKQKSPGKLYDLVIIFIWNYVKDLNRKLSEISHRDLSPICLPRQICENILEYGSEYSNTRLHYFLFLHCDAQRVTVENGALGRYIYLLLQNRATKIKHYKEIRCLRNEILHDDDLKEVKVERHYWLYMAAYNFISFDIIDLDEKTLTILSERATNLEIFQCISIPKNTFGYLNGSIRGFQGCLNLRKLSYMMAFEGITPDTVVTAKSINNLKNLEMLNLTQYNGRNFESNLNLKELYINNLDVYYLLAGKGISTNFPNLKIVGVNFLTNLVQHTFFSNFLNDIKNCKNLREIRITKYLTESTRVPIPFNLFGEYLRENGKKLTVISLVSISVVDLSLIMKFCQNLEILDISKAVGMAERQEFMTNLPHETKLRIFSFFGDVQETDMIFKEMVSSILANSPNIEESLINNGISVEEIIEATHKHGFPCLEKIRYKIRSANIQEDVQTLLNLLDLDNPLKYLEIRYERKDNDLMNIINNFVLQRNLDINIKFESIN